jgi:hypothetical protein
LTDRPMFSAAVAVALFFIQLWNSAFSLMEIYSIIQVNTD